VRYALALAAAAACGISLARADRLHLEGGGVVEAERWWIEGDTVHVESAEGTVGFPRSILRRVERTGAKPSPKAAPAPAAAAVAPVPEDDALRLMSEGNAAIAARDFETASRRFREVIRLRPEAVGPRVGFAVSEISLGREYGALPVVLDGLARDPEAAPLLELLGDLRNREERVADALTAWREAFRIAPSDRLRDRIEKGERELGAARDYSFSAAAHFNVRYDGEIDQDLVAAILDTLEARYAELSSTYRHAPGAPITVLLYPRQTFRDVTLAAENVAGLFDGKIRIPLGGLTRMDPQCERVLTHELTHAIVQSKTRGNCPRWLHEGLAQIAEDRPITRSDRIKVGRAVRVEDPSSWPDAAFTYPASLALTRWLEEQRGFDVLVSVVERLGEGASLDEALSAYYGRDYQESARAWARTLREDGS
jgi:tetratricopeptide (TPR) repeat protein